MPENFLLLPGAKSAILVDKPSRSRVPAWLRGVGVVLGIVAVVAGGIDVLSRFDAQINIDLSTEDLAFTAFGPGTLALNPELRGQLTATSSAPLVPTRLIVPTIEVEAKVEPVGKTPEGAMATPRVLANVAWYELGAKPGGPGNAVFAGHVNNALGLPGVFKNLNQVRSGDKVLVVGESGEELTYTVERVALYKENEAPLEEIFAKTGPSRIVLVTCEGEWDETTRTFDKRLVVVARLQ